jgi:hypothetical protein
LWECKSGTRRQFELILFHKVRRTGDLLNRRRHNITGTGILFRPFEPRQRWVSMGTLHEWKAAFAARIASWAARQGSVVRFVQVLE